MFVFSDEEVSSIYLQIFVRTAAYGALTVLTAAQAYDWANDQFVANAEVVGWGLLMALIAALVATGHAFATSPAVTPIGKALRQAVQTLVAAPIASVIIDSMSDVVELADMVVPTIVAVVLAFLVAWLSNTNTEPTAHVVPAGKDFVGVKGRTS